MSSGIKKKSARDFYAMMALLKCGQFYMEALRRSEGVHYYTRKTMNMLDNQINKFENGCLQGLSKPEQTVWQQEWKRDFIGLSVIVDLWVNMSDEQRDQFEQSVIEFSKQKAANVEAPAATSCER